MKTETIETHVTRDRRRRRSGARATTIPMKRLTRSVLRLGAAESPPADEWLPRPRTRGECLTMERPCPYVSCRYHLGVDVDPRTGSIKFNRPDLEPWEMSETCALDVADRGGCSLEEGGQLYNLTRERIRQIEATGLAHLKTKCAAAGLTLDNSGLLEIEAARDTTQCMEG